MGNCPRKENMKKQSLLFLLPLAMIVTACGNLDKGDIFNEKFMKRNFGQRVEIAYQTEAPNKQDLSFGDGVTAVAPQGTQGILTITKGENKGLFNVYNNKYVLPVDKYDDGGISVFTNNTVNRKFFAGKKTVETVTTLYVYDEDGNKLYEGANGELSFIGSQIDRWEVEGNEHSVVVVKIGGISKAFATYNVDRTLKEVISEEEYSNKHPYLVDGERLSAYGHKDIILVASNQAQVGVRYSAFNEKKGKYLSSFVIPTESIPFSFKIGDYIFYQTFRELNEREKKYDFYAEDAGLKYNFETYKVNYLTGKETKVNTRFVFASMNATRNLYNAKGVANLFYINGVREINRDKTLTAKEKGLVLNEKLKAVADVSGINLNGLTEFENYYISDNGNVYGNKLKEVGYSSSNVADKHIVTSQGAKGLVDHTGKFIYRPVAQQLTAMLKGYYLAQFANKFQILKMSDKEKVDVIKEVEAKDYVLTSGTMSLAHLLLEGATDHKAYVLDITTGAITEAPKNGETDTLVHQFNGSFNGSSLSIEGNVYKSGDNYYVLRDSTKAAYSYAKSK